MRSSTSGLVPSSRFKGSNYESLCDTEERRHILSSLVELGRYHFLNLKSSTHILFNISGPLFRTLPTAGLQAYISIASDSYGRSRSIGGWSLGVRSSHRPQSRL